MEFSTSLQAIFSLDADRATFDVTGTFAQLDLFAGTVVCPTKQLVISIMNYKSNVLELLLSSRVYSEVTMRIRDFLLKPWPTSRSQLPAPQFQILRRVSTLLASSDLHPANILQSQNRFLNLDAVLSDLVEFHADESGGDFQLARSPLPSPRVSKIVNRATKTRQYVYRMAGFKVPRCMEEFDGLMERCIQDCATIMQTYLAYLENAPSVEVAKHAERQFLSTAKVGKADKSFASVKSDTACTLGLGARVGPQKALACLRDGTEDAKWLVVLAHRALKQIRQLAFSDMIAFKAVQLRIRELREGFFPPRNQEEFLGNEFGIPLYLTYVSDDMAIVYQIDCGGPDKDPSYESQYIRIYDVTTVDLAFWRSVAKQLARKDKKFQARCNERSPPLIKRKGISVIPPIKYQRGATASQAVEYSDPKAQKSLGEKLSLDLHCILALEKFVPYSLELFEAIKTAKDGTFMFAMSPPERDIIRYDSSFVVLGRSGTGKTTAMMFKMLAYDLAATQEGIFYRQMFVTQSPALAEKIRLYHNKLKNSSLDMNDSHASQSSALPDFALDDFNFGNRTVPNSFPTRFSGLQNHHFPLFLSFEELCEMLAADLNLSFDPDMLSTRKYRSQRSRPKDYRQGLITFKYFKAEIWPRISFVFKIDGPKLIGFDPMLVYNEFMGVIKGTEQTLNSISGFLDLPTYEALSARSHPVFASNRRRIYEMFTAYQRLRPRRTYDMADRTHAILKAIRKNGGIPGTPVDFLYIDEAQDNLLIDAALLRQLCPNPHGLFYAGDTAQTVSVGSSFRFDDLTAFLWRLERNEPLVQAGKRAPADPTFFQLSTNYRSHAGIIQAAAFIVSLLGRYFPNSVDYMAPEQALVPGPRPMFFLNRPGKTPFDTFVTGDCDTQQKIAFGSEQVIIVRDEAARQRLLQKIGKQAGIVMTLYASKGQEFNDVLLYDFFTDSLASDSDWRSLLHAERQRTEFGAHRAGVLEQKRAVLQTELKCMYVGITRARERVWFWDTGKKGDPWKDLMSDLGLATSFDRHRSIPNLAVRSTAREWASRGKECFTRHDYANATLCFENAGMSWWKSITTAYETRQAAETLLRGSRHRQEQYLAAAKSFVDCAKAAASAKDKVNLLTSAARCYGEAEEDKLAGDTFIEVQLFNDALHHYHMADLLDDAMSVIETHRSILDSDLVKTVESVARCEHPKKFQGGGQRSQFDAYTALVPPDNSMSTRIYFFHLRGILPKIMSYLGRFLRVCRKEKKSVSGKVKDAAHRPLGDIPPDKKEIIGSFIKNVEALIVKLGPQSTMHAEGSLDHLRDQVRQILDLRDEAIKLLPDLPDLLSENEEDSDYQGGVLFMLPLHSAPNAPETNGATWPIEIRALYFESSS